MQDSGGAVHPWDNEVIIVVIFIVAKRVSYCLFINLRKCVRASFHVHTHLHAHMLSSFPSPATHAV